MQSISTKYFGPTNNRGSRVKAIASGGESLTVGWRHDLNHDENHRLVALALAKKLNWSGRWIGGATKTGSVYVRDSRNGDEFTV